MTDRELLELAAKAAGWAEIDFDGGDGWANVYDDEGHQSVWNPLTNDGDALRLAVKLKMRVDMDYPAGTEVEVGEISLMLTHYDDPYAATRRVIVRAAAEIGKGME